MTIEREQDPAPGLMTCGDIKGAFEAERERFAERLWRAGAQPSAGGSWRLLTKDGRATWRRVAAEAIRWSVEP